MSQQPVVVFVDDEPKNLTVFEYTVPQDWRVHTFDNAVDALKSIKELDPWIIVSDQKMPNMTGLEFLEVASQITPEACRIIVTGQTQESTLVQLIRRAKIFDFINKPWDPEAFLSQLEKGINYFKANRERRLAFEELKNKNEELEKINRELAKLTSQLKEANARELSLSHEISAWAPGPIVDGIKNGTLKFPMEKDIVGITYDMISSQSIAEQKVGQMSIRSHVTRIFTECLLKHGGLPESWSGDSMYGHFGAIASGRDLFAAALGAAQEFRVTLRGFCQQNNLKVECGIALHLAKRALVQVDEIKVMTADGERVQKTFHTESKDIDLLHRVEKLIHELPGSNIVMTQDFFTRLKDPPPNVMDLGEIRVQKSGGQYHLYIIPSYFCNQAVVDDFIRLHSFSTDSDKAAA